MALQFPALQSQRLNPLPTVLSPLAAATEALGLKQKQQAVKQGELQTQKDQLAADDEKMLRQLAQQFGGDPEKIHQALMIQNPRLGMIFGEEFDRRKQAAQAQAIANARAMNGQPGEQVTVPGFSAAPTPGEQVQDTAVPQGQPQAPLYSAPIPGVQTPDRTTELPLDPIPLPGVGMLRPQSDAQLTAADELKRKREVAAKIAEGAPALASKEAIANAKNEEALLKAGYRKVLDPETGEASYALTPEGQRKQDALDAVDALKKAQADEASASADLKRAQADPKSSAYALAQQRVDIARQNAATARERLGLSEATYNSRSLGKDAYGNPLPGAMITDQGQTVGSSFSNNVRPTGAERNKADLANSAHEQIASMKDIVAKRQDIFGPLAGRKTDFTVWVGSQDPDAQRFRAARTIAGDHLAGVFGGRSEAALNALDDAIGHFKDNPAAITAGLDQLDKANDSFIKAGTVKTVGSNAGSLPKGNGKVIDAGTAAQFYKAAGNDPAKARQLAKDNGWVVK